VATMSEPVCLNCGATIARRYRESTADWQGRKYCSTRCFYTHRYQAPLGPVPQCQTCGQSIPRPEGGRPSVWLRRKFCSNECRPRKMPSPNVTWEATAADFIEDVEDLLRLGVNEWEVCRRLNSSAEAIGRRLLRWGRGDLAVGFWSLSKRQKQRGAA